MEKNNKAKVDELRQGLGASAEMALIFMRAALGAGATMEEALRLTQAYIGALIFGRPAASEQSEE